MLRANPTSDEAMLRAYLECAAWSSQDISYKEEHPADQDGLPWSQEAVDKANADCVAFLSKIDMDAVEDFDQLGHDFWLTRNGHGAGFWDGDWPEPLASELTKLSKAFGELNVYSDRGELHFT